MSRVAGASNGTFLWHTKTAQMIDLRSSVPASRLRLRRPGNIGRSDIDIHVREIKMSVRGFCTARIILDLGKGFVHSLRRENDLPALAGPRLDKIAHTGFRFVAEKC